VAKIDEIKFGCITVEGKKYRQDVFVLADGTVKKRRGGFLMFGSHTVTKKELEELSQGQPDIIIVGTGTDGAAHVAPEAAAWARESNLELAVLPSYEAVTKLNELTGQGRKVAALIHITC